MKRLALLALFTFSGLALGTAQGPGGFGPPQGFPGPGGPGQDLKLVKDFDKNKDGWLNNSERQSARESLALTGGIGRGDRGGRGGRGPGGPGGPPGGLGRGFESGPAAKGVTIKPSDVQSYPNASLYDENVLRTLFLTFENSDWERELQDFHGTDVDVPVNLTVDGKSYRDVGIHFRGNSSYMGVPEGRKRSLNLSLDMVHNSQTLGGYRTLNLLNSHEDPTFMRAVLFLHVAREYIPAPKANFVRVVINGENWGVYANVQQFNKDFLKENYKEDSGARWKSPGSPIGRSGLEYLGDSAAQYKQLFEIKSKDDAAQWAALVQLCKVLNETPPDRLERALSPILDIDGVLKFLALDNTLVNGDGYWSRASDYSLYRDTAGKFHIIPHDTNETFTVGGGPGGRGGPRGPGGRGGPDGVGVFGRGPRGFDPQALGNLPGPGGTGGFPPQIGPAGPMGMMGGSPTLDPLIGLDDPSKPLRSKLLAVPALREKYLKYVREISTKWLDWKTLGPLVERYQTQIDAEVKRDTKKLESYEAFVAGIAGSSRSLKSFADTRREFLRY